MNLTLPYVFALMGIQAATVLVGVVLGALLYRRFGGSR